MLTAEERTGGGVAPTDLAYGPLLVDVQRTYDLVICKSARMPCTERMRMRSHACERMP